MIDHVVRACLEQQLGCDDHWIGGDLPIKSSGCFRNKKPVCTYVGTLVDSCITRYPLNSRSWEFVRWILNSV